MYYGRNKPIKKLMFYNRQTSKEKHRKILYFCADIAENCKQKTGKQKKSIFYTPDRNTYI